MAYYNTWTMEMLARANRLHGAGIGMARIRDILNAEFGLSLTRDAVQSAIYRYGLKGKPIPISAAKRIADEYGYDQVVIIARAVDSHEHVTTYGRNRENCDVAARIGYFLKHKIMKWPEPTLSVNRRDTDEAIDRAREPIRHGKHPIADSGEE